MYYSGIIDVVDVISLSIFTTRYFITQEYSMTINHPIKSIDYLSDVQICLFNCRNTNKFSVANYRKTVTLFTTNKSCIAVNSHLKNL